MPPPRESAQSRTLGLLLLNSGVSIHRQAAAEAPSSVTTVCGQRGRNEPQQSLLSLVPRTKTSNQDREPSITPLLGQTLAVKIDRARVASQRVRRGFAQIRTTYLSVSTSRIDVALTRRHPCPQTGAGVERKSESASPWRTCARAWGEGDKRGMSATGEVRSRRGGGKSGTAVKVRKGDGNLEKIAFQLCRDVCTWVNHPVVYTVDRRGLDTVCELSGKQSRVSHYQQ